MSKPFDMELFLAGVLIGSRATRQRHLRQAKLIKLRLQIAGSERRLGPGKKHLSWFLEHRLCRHSEATRYYYALTVRLIVRRLKKHGISTSDRVRCMSDSAICSQRLSLYLMKKKLRTI